MRENLVLSLNHQVQEGFRAAFLYLSLSVEMREHGLQGAGHWLRQQYREECEHSLRLIDYLEAHNGRMHVPKVQRVACTWTHPHHLWQCALHCVSRMSFSLRTALQLAERENAPSAQEILSHSLHTHLLQERALRHMLHDEPCKDHQETHFMPFSTACNRI